VTARQIADGRASIVVCGYNQAAYLTGALDSALGQTYRDVEVVVVDNGSTDESHELLQRYRGHPRVRLLVHTTNAPVTQRLNEAIALSSGEYVSILYADDYYLPQKIQRQLDAFAQLPPDYGVVYSPSYRLDDETGKRWIDPSLKQSGDILEQMFVRHYTEGFINPISPLIRRECFVRYPFHEDVFVEGESIFLRFALTYKFRYLDEPLTVMREHRLNMGKAVKRNAAMALILMDKLSREPEFPPHLAPALNAFRANFLGVCGWLGIRMAADPAWARTCVLSAIRRRPGQLFRLRTLGTLALSVLPATGLRLFNQAMNATRAHNETVAFKADYT
jgi:glycosyltransferase involved in cell wall biosynthesis